MKSSWFYRLASANNDVRAVASGSPKKVAKRFLVRKPLWRIMARELRKATR